jgi:predicted nucleotidyltransferase
MNLKDSILKTIKYFDVQDHALTLIEIAKYLIQPENESSFRQNFSGSVAADSAAVDNTSNQNILLSQIEKILENDLAVQIGHQNGFYFLKGRETLSQKRLQNNFYASPRLQRAKKYLPRARFIPFIKAVALSGSEAISNSKKGSDIDLLVLTQKKRMWLGRLFISFYFQVLGMRRHGQFIENRFCLNHYVEAGKELQSDHNLYTAVEYVSLIPFFGGAEIFKFQQNNIVWIKKYLLQPQFVQKQTPLPSVFQRFWQRLLSGKIGDFLEALARRYQLRRIRIQDYITVESDELSFHPGSKGQQVLKKMKA